MSRDEFKKSFNHRLVARLKQLGGGGGGGASKLVKQRSRFSKQNNNFAHASHFLVHFFAVTVRGLPREIA